MTTGVPGWPWASPNPGDYADPDRFHGHNEREQEDDEEDTWVIGPC